MGVTEQPPLSNPVSCGGSDFSSPTQHKAGGSSFDARSTTIDDFAPHIGSTFTFQAPDGGTVELQLQRTIEEYHEVGRSPETRCPYSLVFVAADDRVYPQFIRTLEHPVLGALDVFLVPFQVRDEKVHYNVVIG